MRIHCTKCWLQLQIYRRKVPLVLEDLQQPLPNHVFAVADLDWTSRLAVALAILIPEWQLLVLADS